MGEGGVRQGRVVNKCSVETQGYEAMKKREGKEGKGKWDGGGERNGRER